MLRKIVAVSVSLAMLFGFVVIVDVITDLTPTVKAATLYVNTTGSGGAYTSIQNAINGASDGDIVFVYSGIYNENIVVDKTINLTGQSRDYTIIDGNGAGDVVVINADWVNITGFTFTNCGSGNGDAGIELNYVIKCKVVNNNASNNQRGINIYYSNEINIIGNNVTNNFVGIHLDNSYRNNITDNIAKEGDYGIYLRYSEDNNIIDNNVSSYIWNGINLYNSNENNISGNNINSFICKSKLM